MEINKIGIYCRLSKEDGQNESLSIVNQKNILIEYVRKNFNCEYKIYIDDGYSGTNFNRPDFVRLLQDIEKNLLNCVVIKDLSRLGRNYLQVGYYLEDYFPSKNIRCIALSDNYDSNSSDDFIPFKNIINEWYAKDISKKVRFTLDNYAKTGSPRKTAFPLYGYKYDKDGLRIIDPKTSVIVKLIYEEFIKYKSVSIVQKILKEERIITPGYYNYLNYNYNENKYNNTNEIDKFNWLSETIYSILRNVEYTGVYVTKKTKTKSYKLSHRIKTSEEERNYFSNKYPKIISEGEYYQVQEILKSIKKERTSTHYDFDGILFCGGCLKRMYLNKSKRRYDCINKSCNNRVYIKIDELNCCIDDDLSNIKKEFFEIIAKDYRLTNPKKESLINKNKTLLKYIKRLIETDLDDTLIKNQINEYKKEYDENNRDIENLSDEITIDLNNLDLRKFICDIYNKIIVYRKMGKDNLVIKEAEIIYNKLK